VGARYWGPGVFREALAERRVRQLSRTTFAPGDGDRDDRADESKQ
jgi:hypothetical protein